MPDQLQLRGGTTTEHNSFTGVTREVTVDTTKKTLVVHDGSTQGGTPLMKESGSNAASSVGIGTGGTNAINIDSSQKVGIGTASPAQILHLNKSSGDTYLRIQGGTNQGTLIHKTDGNLVGGFVSGGAVGGSVNDIAMRVESGNNMLFAHGTTERMRISSAGRVGIGLTNAAAELDIATSVEDSTGTLAEHGIRLSHVGATDEEVVPITGGFVTQTGRARAGIGFISKIASATEGYAGAIGFYTRSSADGNGLLRTDERMRLDQSGRLLLGTSTARAVGGESNPVLHIEGAGNTSNSWVNLTRFQSTTAGPNFQFAKARSNTPGTYTLVQSGDTLGTISFLGADGTDMANYAATISAQVDGTAGSNDMPGRLVFSTTADGAGTSTERMRIDSSGRLLLGTTTEGHANGDDLTIATSGDTGMTIRSGSSSNGRIYFSDATTGTGEYAGALDYDHADNSLKLFTDATERLRITSSGNVNIKTNNAELSGSGTLRVNSGSTTGTLNLDGGASNHGGEINLTGGSSGGRIQFRSGQAAGTQSERMRLDENGKLGIGTSSPTQPLHVLSTTNPAILARNDSGGTGIRMQTDNGSACSLSFSDTDAHNQGLILYHHADNRMQFSTGGVERMRITSAGKVGIGTTVPAYHLHVKSDSANSNARFESTDEGIEIELKDSTGTGFVECRNDFRFKNNSGELVRINSSGQVGIGTTSPSAHLAVEGDGNQTLRLKNTTGVINRLIFQDNASRQAEIIMNTGHLQFSPNSSGAVRFQLYENGQGQHWYTTAANPKEIFNWSNNKTGMSFRSADTERGNIYFFDTGVQFNTSSDYRLKENVTALSDGITRVKQLTPRKFNWIVDESNTAVDGFLAHEVSATVPEAINGIKDAVATQEDVDSGRSKKVGDPIYQMIDHSKLVPLLTAALQEAITKIETLETKVAALEAA